MGTPTIVRNAGVRSLTPLALGYAAWLLAASGCTENLEPAPGVEKLAQAQTAKVDNCQDPGRADRVHRGATAAVLVQHPGAHHSPVIARAAAGPALRHGLRAARQGSWNQAIVRAPGELWQSRDVNKQRLSAAG